MKVSKLSEMNQYQPPCHFGTQCVKVQGEETGLKTFWQGISTFDLDGGAEWQYEKGTFGADKEKTYVVIEGEISVENEAGEIFVAGALDSISMLPNEKRRMWNSGSVPAKVVVTFNA
ncbi:hypothetical protein [Vibrio hippocampi]|uniref:Cupin domain-containing protein n=1 Tax=Vibrio hippocampi TaxID=654686 RepID=A0ABM8ZLW9_9VIBR|nr:hypothetical protein [Vibrio hippocampi]CAH0529522.1 hypothetical protein VHP8226_03276 [Vibrio hippocampi]